MDHNESGRTGAEWIWIRPPPNEFLGLIPRGEPDFRQDLNRFVYFRKEFEMPGEGGDGMARAAGAAITTSASAIAGGTAPAGASATVRTPVTVRASAGGRYILFVNGVRVGRGPARCHPEWQYVDPYEISGFLRPGKNVVAALVHSYGRDTSWYETPRGMQAILFGSGGFRLRTDVGADTDASWKFLASEAWERDTPFGGTGFAEWFDAEKEPQGWNLPGFDDSTWEFAHVQRAAFPAGGADKVPFPRLVDRDIAHLRETPAEPVGVTEHPSSRAKVYDFGRILMGRIRIEADAPAGSSVEIESGETLAPGGLVFKPAAIPGISTPRAHRIRFRDGRQAHTLFEAEGFRYVQVTEAAAGPSAGTVPITVSAEESTYPIDSAGTFACSDPELTALWQAGAYTASVCRQDGFIDCPSREQRQWTGDADIQGLLNYVTCGDTRLVRKVLLQTAQTQRPDGMVMMASASDLEADGRTFIPDFCLHWIISIGHYVLHTGDASILPELFPAVAKAIAWFTPYIDAHGLLGDTPGWIFVDWSERLERRGEVLALNALFAAALRAAAMVADRVEAAAYARGWRALADSVSAAAAERFWDGERGLYADAWTDSGLSRVASQQANAAAVAFGIAPASRRESIFAAVLDPARVKLTKAWRWDRERDFDPEKDIVMAQPFLSHFLHAALAASGRVADIVANLKERWGPMLREGGTFWESWQMTEMTSRCHGFSATPVYDISAYVLGIRPLADGYSRFRVEPYFGGLEWARGGVPTPAGIISTSWSRLGDSVEIEVEVPSPLSGELVVNAGGGEGRADAASGAEGPDGSKGSPAADGRTGAASGAARFPLEPGINRFTVPMKSNNAR